MATFKELKNKLQGKTKNETKTKNEIEDKIEYPELEIEEVRYLLSLIARSDFNGKDVQVLYNIALKLQKTMAYCLDKDENG
tara:strand:- start:484 stop:726 length:243 start_codon:yes stop_codon:yes gene_type:complete